MNKNSIIILVIILIVIIVGVYFFTKPDSNKQGAALSQSVNQNNSSTSYDVQGMKIETLKEGTGAEAKVGNTVTVNYTGTLVDGTKFDSSLNPGRTPFQFTLGQNRVIQGWELGVLGMKVGEKRKLTIPPGLGYGAQSVGGIIPANATLIFEIDLLGVN